ncbi:hypothetical protein PUN28_001233 [Cardiocondyla obscurior]|uniref:Uncharacterized protein n=1 Tax=Cardiocondyla obscurior TaxID=286306 RepID=A0AAW2H4E6_9HYME
MQQVYNCVSIDRAAVQLTTRDESAIAILHPCLSLARLWLRRAFKRRSLADVGAGSSRAERTGITGAAEKAEGTSRCAVSPENHSGHTSLTHLREDAPEERTETRARSPLVLI